MYVPIYYTDVTGYRYKISGKTLEKFQMGVLLEPLSYFHAEYYLERVAK